MNLLQRLILGKKLIEQLQTKAARQTFQMVNGQLISPKDNKEAYLNDGYLINDILYSIISIIIDKVRLPQWNQYKVIDESSLKSYTAIMRKKDMSFDDFKLAKKLKVKALELIEGDARLNELLKYPNEQEAFADFVAGGTVYKLVTGDRFIWAEKLELGANQGKPMSLWNLPSQYMTIKATTDFPAKVQGYQLFTWNQTFEKEDVLHDKYFNPEWNINGQQLYGMSPLKAALKRYTRNNLAMTAASAAFNNQGIKGVIAPNLPTEFYNPGNTAELIEQSNKVKKLLSGNEYAGAEAYGKIAASAYPMTWTDIGLSPVDLNILESEKWDAVMLCNIFGVPPELLGLTQKTYNNAKEAEKALTSRSAIPLLVSFRECFNHKLKTDWGFKDKNIFVDFDQTVFTELEENVKDKVEWVTKLGALGVSPNRQLELIGLETIDNPLYDEPWRDPTGLVPESELGLNEIDKAVNDMEGDK